MANDFRLPKDDNNDRLQLMPPALAKARTVTGTLSTSTQITFNASSRALRVYALSQDIYLKWGTTAVTAANFDEVIPAGQIFDLFVPIDISAPYTACTLLQRTASGSAIVIEK